MDDLHEHIPAVRAYSTNLANQLAKVWNNNAEYLEQKDVSFDVKMASICAGIAMFFDGATQNMPDMVFYEILIGLRKSREEAKDKKR